MFVGSLVVVSYVLDGSVIFEGSLEVINVLLNYSDFVYGLFVDVMVIVGM